MAGPAKYTAQHLANLAFVALRTVRYYIQKGLIDPPHGRGPGAHFDDRHLIQLRRAKFYQRLGMDLDTIRQHANELDRILADRGLTLETATLGWAAYARGALSAREEEPGELEAEAEPGEDEALDTATAIRIPMARGVELLVHPTVKLPSPRRLVEIAFLVRKLFGVR